MKCQIPQISWHGRDPVLSLDFQVYDKKVRRLATGGTDAHVLIWHVTLCPKNSVNVECVCDLERHNKSVNVVRFSPNGEFLASGDDEGGIFIWRLKEKTYPELDGEETATNKENWAPFKLLRGHLDDICDLCWSPNNERLISGSIDNSVVIWDIQKGLSVQVGKEAKGFVQGVTWDPHNQYFASISSDRILRMYNVGSGKVVHRIHRAVAPESAGRSLNKFNKLFHDDTLQSFCRRLCFSPDGELLFVPSGIREKDEKLIHTTYVFSRYDFPQPVFHLPSGEKYTVAVRCCPLLFELRENNNANLPTPLMKLPYRILVAVATQDAIYLYDTQQFVPFAYISNIHYAHLTDITWSSDGQMIVASSTDGYCSVIIFNEDELGEVYVPEPVECEDSNSLNVSSLLTDENKIDSDVKSSKLLEGSEAGGSQSSDKQNCDRSPRKSKTPKKSKPPSAKKSSVKKIHSRNIASFFSPRGKLFKESQDSENTSLKSTNEEKDFVANVTESKSISEEKMEIDECSVEIIEADVNAEQSEKIAVTVDIDMENNECDIQEEVNNEMPVGELNNEITRTKSISNDGKAKVEITKVNDVSNNDNLCSADSENVLPSEIFNGKPEMNLNSSTTPKQKRRIQLITL